MGRNWRMLKEQKMDVENLLRVLQRLVLLYSLTALGVYDAFAVFLSAGSAGVKWVGWG